jgi:hypothetical protein
MAFTLHMVDSFDVGTDPGIRWTAPSNAFIGPGGRGGSQRLMTGTGTTGTGIVTSTTLPGANIRTTGFAVKLSPFGTGSKTLVRIMNGLTLHFEIRAVPSGGAGSAHSLQLYRSTTFLTSAGGTIWPGVWTHLCFKVELSATAGQVIILVDGAETHSAQWVTQNGATTTSTAVALLGAGSTEYDDFYTGGSDTTTAGDMLGDKRVATIVPGGPGDQTDLSATGAATNWEAASTDDGDSSFVWSRTPGDYDLYTLQPLDNPVLSVDAVIPFAVARKDDAGSRVLRMVTKSGTTTTESGDLALSEAYQFFSSSPLYQDPDTSTAWDQNSLGSLQIGPKVQG